MNVMFFSKRLRRLLGGEEAGTLPDEIKEQIQNLQKETEVMTSFVRAFEYGLTCCRAGGLFAEEEDEISSGEEDGEEKEDQISLGEEDEEEQEQDEISSGEGDGEEKEDQISLGEEDEEEENQISLGEEDEEEEEEEEEEEDQISSGKEDEEEEEEENQISLVEEDKDQISLAEEEELQTSLSHGEAEKLIKKIMRKIMFFVLKSEKAIDTFLLDMLQNKNESCKSKELCDDLQYLKQTIGNFRVEMEQPQPNQSSNSSNDHEYSCSSSIALERKNIRDFLIKNKTRMVGREDEMEKVLDLLIEGQPSLTGVSIMGVVGVGKRTLAAEVYDNIYVKSYFDCRAWVECYPPFTKDDLLDAILKSVMLLSGLSEIMGQNYQLKKTTLGDYLRSKKYLIIWVDCDSPDCCMEDLKDILPDYNNGSRILMTTGLVADYKLSYYVELKYLNEKQSWDILTEGDFGKQVSDLLDLETFKKTFENVCLGLPASIVRFRSLLAEKDQQDAILKMTNYFQEKSRFDDVNVTNDIAIYIYKNLPDHLKPCLIYLLFFSIKNVIDTRQLYLLWIAEGFVEDNNEATAEKYLEEIVIRGFIKVTRRSSGGRIKTCHFGDRVTAEVQVLAACTGLLNYFNSSPLAPLSGTCARLFQGYHFYSSYPHLRSLLFPTSINEDHAQLDGSYVSGNLKFLKLLDVGNLALDHCPTIIEKLLLLRYLKLNIPSLKALPSSFCNLVNLFTLDMPSSYTEEVPDDFWKM